MKKLSLRKPARGITLVELMIVVVIVAVLASIAIPNYRQYVIRSTRTEAKAALLRVQAAEEKFYLQKNRYAVTEAELIATPPDGLGLSALSEGGSYKISLAVDKDLGSQGYSATAEPADKSGQKQDKLCQKLTINHLGARTPAVTTSTPCWR